MKDPKTLFIFAGLGLGAYFLTMRSAKAGTVNGLSYRPPTTWAQNPTRAVQLPSGRDTAVAAGINLLGKILGSSSDPIYRSPTFTPGYVPDTAGEAAARDYYLANQDAFAVNPPTTFTSDPQLYASTGGWADSR